METQPEKLYLQHTDKTRILISGSENLAPLVLHILDFCGVEVDFLLNDNHTSLKGADFIILENHNIKAANFRPNIALVASLKSRENEYLHLLKNIIAGGVLIYSENDEFLNRDVENTENYFRKLPYTASSEVSKNEIKSPFGTLPLNFSESSIITHIEGIKLLSQQLGVMEEEFYEALMMYAPIPSK